MDRPNGPRTVDDVLAHFGVKGMRWGVRKSDPGAGASSGGSEDHQKVVAVKTKIKSGGTKSLSNQELQDFITRANLEKQFNSLNKGSQQKVSKFITDFLLEFGKQQARQFANEQLRALLKKAA